MTRMEMKRRERRVQCHGHVGAAGPAEPARRSKRQRGATSNFGAPTDAARSRFQAHSVDMVLRAIPSALRTLPIQSAPVITVAMVVGLWTGWFDNHAGALAVLIGWFALLLVEIWVEVRRW